MPSILGPQHVEVGRRVVLGAIGVVTMAVPAAAQTQTWIDQFGGELDDGLLAAVPDSVGGVFVCGYYDGDHKLYKAGPDDALLMRFDAAGTRLWTQVLATPRWEAAMALAADGSGGVFVAGMLNGPLGGASSGHWEAWLARYDASGARQWFEKLGGVTPHELTSDGAGGVYLVGQAGGGPDGYIARFDSAGTQLWATLSTSKWYDYQSAAADGQGGIYVVGSFTTPSLEGQGGLVHYDGSGAQLWQVTFGTSSGWDEASVALSDGTGGVLVGGYLSSSLSQYSAFYAQYDSAGNELWFQQDGSSGNLRPNAIAPDGTGGFYVSTVKGICGVFLKRYDALGHPLWSKQITGQSCNVYAWWKMPKALAWDGGTGVFIGGSTNQDLDGPNAGGVDAWLARYDGSCNSGKTYCTASATSIPGCTAALSATGSPTLSDPSAWTVSSGPVPGGDLGLLLFGSSGKDNTPYGTLGGKICVASPTFRTAPKLSGGDQGQCNGSYGFALADLIGASPIITSSATIHAQVWARDPANPDGFLLSNGLEVLVCP